MGVLFIIGEAYTFYIIAILRWLGAEIMLKKLLSGSKEVLFGVVRFFISLKHFFIFILVSSILALGWFAFLKLVSKPPIDPTPVLIMIWLSILVLFVTLFPKILDRIKRLKFKDIEIELQDTVSKTSTEDYISLFDFKRDTFSVRENFNDLTDMIRQSVKNPDRPILLVVNLMDDKYISIPMLFIYLFFLDLISNSITVLFISAGNKPANFGHIKKNTIIGAASGRQVLKELCKQFPKLYSAYDCFSRSPEEVEQIFQYGYFDQEKRDILFDRMNRILQEHFYNEKGFLTLEAVERMLKQELNRYAVDLPARAELLDEIGKALERGNEFILLFERKTLKSIMSLANFTKELSVRVIRISKSS